MPFSSLDFLFSKALSHLQLWFVHLLSAHSTQGTDHNPTPSLLEYLPLLLTTIKPGGLPIGFHLHF
jgi:hypothetical protein